MEQLKFEELRTIKPNTKLPDYIQNRNGKVKFLDEDALINLNNDFAVETMKRVEQFKKNGVDISPCLTWLSRWKKAFDTQDTELIVELCTEDIIWDDPSLLGQTLHGRKELFDITRSFEKMVPDMRYDFDGPPYFDWIPDVGLRMVIPWIATGHWEGDMQFYPFKEDSLSVAATGKLLQGRGFDRYWLNTDWKMYRGQTYWDFLEVAQQCGILPAPGINLAILLKIQNFIGKSGKILKSFLP